MSKIFGFSALVFVTVYGFSIFQYLVFTKIMGFRIWYLIRFPFFLFDQFRYQFLFDLSGNYAPPLILLNANVEKNAWNIPGIPKGVQASWITPKTLTIHWVHASWMMPKTLILQCGALRSRLISLQTMSSNVPTVLAMEEGHFFLWRGERQQEFQKEKQG